MELLPPQKRVAQVLGLVTMLAGFLLFVGFGTGFLVFVSFLTAFHPLA